MKNKDISKILNKIKSDLKKQEPKPQPKPYRERDMRNEAMDMGSHQAHEFFGGE